MAILYIFQIIIFGIYIKFRGCFKTNIQTHKVGPYQM